MGQFEIQTRLQAPADEVWAVVTTPEGVDYELAPWLRMTVPARLRGATLDSVPLNQPLGRSWLLLFGVLPVEYDALKLADRSPNSFSEDSHMLTLRRWRHERSVTPSADDGADSGGCNVTDRLQWTGRFPGVDTLAGLITPALFRHRHRRLARRFGAAPAP